MLLRRRAADRRTYSRLSRPTGHALSGPVSIVEVGSVLEVEPARLFFWYAARISRSASASRLTERRVVLTRHRRKIIRQSEQASRRFPGSLGLRRLDLTRPHQIGDGFRQS